MTILINIYLEKCIKHYVLIRGIFRNQSLIGLQSEIGKTFCFTERLLT